MNSDHFKADKNIKLTDIDPNDKSYFSVKKKESPKLLSEFNQRLCNLQRLLYAEHSHKLLLILQAMDTGGKDGTIRNVFKGINPQGVKVVNFKKPTPEELYHDYLWRIHKHTPGKGEIVVFNRSHYEDVLVVCVHNLVPKSQWSKRFDHINSFEKMLSDEGVTILKFFLHIDLDEQKERLQSRLDNKEKHWKFNPNDLKERKLWPNYMKAYENVLKKTSTTWAPWYIIPANRKWYRNLVISKIIIDKLEELKMKYPNPNFGPEKIEIF